MIASLLATSVFLPAQPVLKRALWMWHGRPLIENAEARRQFFDFISAPKGDPTHAISVIFLGEVDPADSKSPALGGLIRECHEKGLRVDFLCGEDSWAQADQNAVAVDKVNIVLKFNAFAPKECRFDGFQFDVEPYALPDWPNPSLRASFLNMFDLSRASIKKAGSSISLGAAIPRWFDAPELGGLEKDVLDRVDYVAVMDYVSTPENFVKDPTKTVAYATKVGKKAWLGAEATELPKEPVATFYAKGNAALENAFSAAQQAYSSQNGFAGVAIEYYETYVALRP